MAEGAEDATRWLRFGEALELDLAWFQKHVAGQAARVSIEQLEVGRMAVVAMVRLLAADGSVARQVVVKRVVPSELEGAKSNPALVASARRELEFYAHSVSPADGDLFPRVYAAEELELGGEPAFLLVMEDLRESESGGVGALQVRAVSDGARAKAALGALAQLCSGARAEEACEALGAPLDQARRGAFWVLARRPSEEVTEAATHWAGFVREFGEVVAPGGLEGLESLGSRLGAIAPALDALVSAECCTLIHGDAKAWNLFFTSDDRVRLIDMQWAGTGHPLQDAVYFMTTSVHCSYYNGAGAGAGAADTSAWDDLLDHFRSCLADNLSQLKHPRAGEMRSRVLRDSPEAFRRLAKVVWLDYARVVCLALWARLTRDKLEANSKRVGISLVTGCAEQMRWILRRALALVDDHEVAAALGAPPQSRRAQ